VAPSTPTSASGLAPMTAWWAQVNGGCQTVVNVLNDKVDSTSAAEQDCSELTTDVQTIQLKLPAPLLSFNTP
jgi:hypothetical protein